MVERLEDLNKPGLETRLHHLAARERDKACQLSEPQLVNL